MIALRPAALAAGSAALPYPVLAYRHNSATLARPCRFPRKENDMRHRQKIAIGIAVGLAIGVAVDMALKSGGIWIGVGLALGIALGSAWKAAAERNDRG